MPTTIPPTSTSKKGGRGTHGSITKAGKVRLTTPKVPKTTKRKKLSPKLRNRKNFKKREVLKRKVGQNWGGDK